MDYAEFSADLPRNRVISFSSAEENEEVMQRNGINQHVRQLGKGSFRADCAMLETNQAMLTADRFNQACSVYLESPPDTVALLVFRSAGEQFMASGENVANDKLVVLPDRHGVDLVTPNLAGSEAVVLSKSKYAELTQVLCPSCAQPKGVSIRKGDTQQLHRMRDAINQIMVGVVEPSDEKIANLVAQMIIWAGYSSGSERPEVICRKQAKIDIAKQVQVYLEENYHEIVRIEDLCRATEKEVRTLQRCFRQYFDITITDHLKMIRLNAAHRALSSAQPDEVSVTSIALQNGFTHIGRFSVEYKQHFGESASESLLKRNSR